LRHRATASAVSDSGDGRAGRPYLDAERRDVVSPLGDVIATGIEPHFLPGIVDRTDAVMRIAKLAESRPQSIDVQPNNAQHRDGERVQFHIKDVDQKYLILFNVSGEGTVQNLFPKPYDAARLAGQKFELPLKVRKPLQLVGCVIAIDRQ